MTDVSLLESTGRFNHLRFYLYHPPADLHERGIGTSALMAFAQRVATTCAETFAHQDRHEWLEVVVGLRPPYDCRAWIISPRAHLDVSLDRLRRDIGMLVPPQPSRSVVFAVSGAFGNAVPRWRTRPDSEFPWPADWAAVPGRCRHSLDGIIDAAWPVAVPRLSAWLRRTLADEGLLEAGQP